MSRYGVAGGMRVSQDVMQIDAFVEKPTIKQAPSNLVALGQYIITPDILQLLKTQKAGKGGEIRLADALITHIKKEGVLYGKTIKGTWYDCGNKLEFIKAQIELGLKHPEVKKGLRKYLKELCK